MRVRGLKLTADFHCLPLAQSHPMRVRGLKLDLRRIARVAPLVAPYAGAWIETPTLSHYSAVLPVAPYAGAWIETNQRQ